MTDVTQEPTEDAEIVPVQAILNASDALGFVARSSQGVGVRELSRSLRLARGTAARVLHSLHMCELLRRDESTGRYHLGARFLELASEHRHTLSLNEIARRHLVGLVAEVRETVMIGILDRSNVVIVDRVDGPQALRMTADLGVIQPAYSCALGKMILSTLPPQALAALLEKYPVSRADGEAVRTANELIADLDRVRIRGWALDDNEQIEGVRCISAAIRDQDRKVVAAISASGPSFRFPDEKLESIAALVKGAADAISNDLGFAPERSQASQI